MAPMCGSCIQLNNLQKHAKRVRENMRHADVQTTRYRHQASLGFRYYTVKRAG